MNIFDTPLGKDVLEVIEFNGSVSVACHLAMEWDVPGKPNIPITRIHQVDTLRDYADGQYDTITAIVEVSVETYQALLYPNRARLKMDVYRTAASKTGAYADNISYKSTYKAFLLTNRDDELFDQTQSGNNSKEKEDSIMHVAIQLMDWEMYKYKNVQYSTILGNGVIHDYLYYFMSHRGELKCSIHPPDNTNDVVDTLIPENIDLIDLANWLQKEGPGIYNHGINTYYQKDMMFVYPTVQLNPVEYRIKVNVFRAGSDVGIGSGNTYAVIDDVLNLISSGESQLPQGMDRLEDNREALEHIHGNSIRWNDPRYQSDVINETNDIMRYTSKNSFIHALPDADVKIQRIHNAHTANPFYQRSILNKTVGRTITIPWPSGDINRLYPDTEVQYYYMKGRSMETMVGFIEGTSETLIPMEGKRNDNIFNIICNLKLRIQ